MLTHTVDIIGYEGRYKVTPDGKILSLPNGSRKNIRELKQEIICSKKAKYRRVTLCKNGKTKRFFVHRLVCSAFHKNPENKPQVNHIDNDGENNKSINLEWVTSKENMRHSEKQGRQNNVKKLGTIAASKKARQQTQQKIEAHFGDRLVKIEYSLKKQNRRRCFITFRCKICGNIYTKRNNTPAIKRGGVCRECI